MKAKTVTIKLPEEITKLLSETGMHRSLFIKSAIREIIQELGPVIAKIEVIKKEALRTNFELTNNDYGELKTTSAKVKAVYVDAVEKIAEFIDIPKTVLIRYYIIKQLQRAGLIIPRKRIEVN